jgi:hypothetical protein
VTNVPPMTFAAVAQPVAAHGWRPFPGVQTSKIPAMKQWPELCLYEWDAADLAATITEYQPVDAFCCCFAIQREIVVLDADIIDPAHAAYAAKLADNILGVTPLIRIGLAPKCIRVYRAADLIQSRKLHPIEIFCGSGQFIAYGWHTKAGRAYHWPCSASPLSINANSHDIPAVTRAQIDRFTSELFKVVPRRALVPTRQGRPNGAGAAQTTTINERLRMLATLHGSWKRAASIVLGEAGEGYYNETLWAVIASAAGHGIAEDVVWESIERHFRGDPKVSDSKVAADIAGMIERTRPVPRPRTMIFTPPLIKSNRP